jgi:hypothetical protein
MRADLTDEQLEELLRWARSLAQQEYAQRVQALIWEVKRLRESEATTRFLMEIEGEV